MTAGRVPVSALTLTSSLTPAGDQAFRTLSFLTRKRGRWPPGGAGRGGAERGLRSPRPSRPDSAGRPCRPRFTDVETEAASREGPPRPPSRLRQQPGRERRRRAAGSRGTPWRLPWAHSSPRPRPRAEVPGVRVPRRGRAAPTSPGRPPSPRMSQPLPPPRLPSSLSGLCAFEVPASPSPLIEIISTVFPEPPH